LWNEPLKDYSDYLQKKRKKHFQIGLKMMLGGALILLAVLIGELFIR